MSKGGSTTTVQKSDPWSGQQPYLQSVFQNAQNVYGQMSGNNGANAVAPMTANQNQAINLTQQQVGQSNLGGVQATNAANDYTTHLLQGDYLGSNPGNQSFGAFANGSMVNNPYLSGMADAAANGTIRNYQTAIAPQITSQMEGSGRYGSGAMANAQSQSQQDLATQLGNQMNNLYGGAYSQGMQNMLAGAQGLSNNYNTAAQQQLQGSYNAPSLQNASSALIGNLYNMGGNQQAYQQQLLNSPWNQLGQYNNLIQGQYGGTQTSTQPYYTNPASGALGGAAAGSVLGPWGALAGGVIGALSDRRAKTDIVKVGKLDNGLNVYSYRYKFGGPHMIGVMADEVKKVKPEAVFDAGGLDAVRYDML